MDTKLLLLRSVVACLVVLGVYKVWRVIADYLEEMDRYMPDEM